MLTTIIEVILPNYKKLKRTDKLAALESSDIPEPLIDWWWKMEKFH